MKKFIFLFVLLHTILFAKIIPFSECKNIAESHLSYFEKENYQIKNYKTIVVDSKNLMYVFSLSPTGFIIIPNNDILKPVLAYSFSSDFSFNERVGAKKILKEYFYKQISNLKKIPSPILRKRRIEWENYKKSKFGEKVEQWPPQGYSDTEGWILTRWNQIYPYNKFCPIDPITGVRSYAGCPAIAISQIINYYKIVYNISFNDTDDYHHYFAGRVFDIDDDFEQYHFLSYPQLNCYLDSLNYRYLYTDEELSSDDKAALIFATGVAAQQVYSSEVSGVFYDSQIRDSYNKFQYSNVIIYPNEENFYNRMIENIQHAMPLQLSLLTDSQTEGHQVVVDGYNTNNYFHINFGWGGSSDGWYNFSDHDMPYSLNVIDCAFVDILPPQLPYALVMGNIILNPIPNNPTENILIKAISNIDNYLFEFLASPDNQNNNYYASLPIGKYRLEISYNGYETFTYENLILQQNDIITMDFYLDKMYSPQNLSAEYHDNHVQLNWNFESTKSFETFNIYKKIENDFSLIDTTQNLYYYDFIENPNGDTLFYYVTAKYCQNNESEPSDTVWVILPVLNEEEEILKKPHKSFSYPNPFNPSTKICFNEPKNGIAYLEIFNLKGEKIYSEKKIINNNTYFIWDGKNMKNKKAASGIYLYRIKAGKIKYQGKLMLLK